MASMFWVPDQVTEPKMPGYDYDKRWFCDQDKVKDCPAGWPGWRWGQDRGASLGRAYNYAHVSSTYLGMYQAACYDDLKTLKPRVWYLNRAYKTIMAMVWVSVLDRCLHLRMLCGVISAVTEFMVRVFALEDAIGSPDC
jgi:hypothetical protein